MGDEGIVRMRPEQVEEASWMLARAFRADPFVSHVVAEVESARGRWFFASGLRYGMRYGEVWTTAGEVAGAAVWLSPGNTSMTPLRMARAGMLAAPVRMGIGAFGRLLRHAGFAERWHHAHAPGPHWYLLVLGVDPGRQGEGVGGRLVGPVLAKADAAGEACYLETMSEVNLPFYRRHGFAVVAEGRAPGDGPYVWAMRREARGTYSGGAVEA